MKQIKKGDKVTCFIVPPWTKAVKRNTPYKVIDVEDLGSFVIIQLPYNRMVALAAFRFKLVNTHISLSKYLSNE